MALPQIQYDVELNHWKEKDSKADEVEQFKKEILVDGLQIEEEGLETIKKTSYARDVLKIPVDSYKEEIVSRPNHKNDTENTIFDRLHDDIDVPSIQEHTFEEWENHSNVVEIFTNNDSVRNDSDKNADKNYYKSEFCG